MTGPGAGAGFAGLALQPGGLAGAAAAQSLHPPVGVSMDLHVADGAFVLCEAPGLGIRIDETLITAAPRADTPGPDGPHVRPERAGRRLLPAGGDGVAPQAHSHPVDVRPGPANAQPPRVNRS